MTQFTNIELEKIIDENKRIIQILHKEIETLEYKNKTRYGDKRETRNTGSKYQILTRIEKGLKDSKDQIKNLENQLSEILKLKKQIENILGEKNNQEIEDQLNKASDARDQLRSGIIPSLKKLLHELEDNKKELDTLVLSLSNQLSKINHNPKSDKYPELE